jgi:hypothetical protein
MRVEDEVLSAVAIATLHPLFCIEEKMIATAQVVGKGVFDGIHPIPENIPGFYELEGWEVYLDSNGFLMEARKGEIVILLVQKEGTSYLTC